MAHGLSLRRSKAGDVSDNRFGHILGDESRGPLFRVASDFTDHDDGVGVRVLLESSEAIDMGRPDDGVTNNNYNNLY